MANDPPSPSRPLVNSTEVSNNTGSHVNTYNTTSTANTTATTAAPRLSAAESSPYQTTHGRTNSVGELNNNNIRRASNSPPPPPPSSSQTLLQSPNPISTAPTYARQRTPNKESSPVNHPVRAPTPIAAPPSTNHVSVPASSTNTGNSTSAATGTAASSTTTTTSTTNNTSAAANSNGYRPLNVKDALTYLDQVKVKFADQPEVYNRFLDIMKEFKSQAIDTPGVIERVSTLFRGHPQLISGFNTFLPPGYRIECSTDDRARDIIKVTTPSGTTSTTSGEPLNLQSETMHVEPTTRYYGHSQQQQQQQQVPYGQQQQQQGYRSSHGNGPLPPISSYHPSPIQSSTSVLPPRSVAAGPPVAQAAAPVAHQQPPPPPSHERRSISPSHNDTRRAPVEFNHAINYVNKIKNRFSNDPETYKHFLEILQTYQKEQQPIQEVYAQVQILFNGANDLLAEFKQFLPDTSQQQQQQQQATTPGDYAMSKSQQQKMKKRTLSGLTKQPKRSKSSHHSNKLLEHHLSDIRRSPIILPQGDDVRPVVSIEEAEFFEKVKKYIGNKTTYHAFLRILNLFSQQILDANMLIEKCESFLGGNKELFEGLQKLVGYDGKDIVIQNLPASVPKPDFSSCQEHGPSYRSVPKSWQAQSCSGRDALCWEVLNDAYVSHPTWASEDSGFIASKKNVFEEALHRVEEERYEFDLNIEANLNTISLLEPIAKKISTMSEEDKNAFKLPVGLGGPSKTIYQRIIKKIYGKEQGADVLDMLHSNPAQTVPVILKRLKQKDEEWKRSQREWNKVWREVEIKNYYKALDYQGVIFKSNDRKCMTVKHLVTEIQTLHMDQCTTSNVEPQFTFSFKNKKIFKDVTRVLYSYFERQTTYGTEDCEVMKAFIEMFLPVFFDVPDVLPHIATSSSDQSTTAEIMLDEDEEMVDDEDAMDEDVDEDEDDDDTQNSYDSSTDTTSRSTRRGYSSRRNGRRSPRHKPHDDDDQRLLKDVLTKTMKAEKLNQSKKEAIQATLEEEEEEEEEDPYKEQKIYNLFGNTTFYCFFRLFQICYDRLCQMKQLDREYRTNPEKTKLMNKAALELNITSATFNSIEMDFKLGYYNALLKLIDRFFDDELDQHVFEECARYIFGTKAYIMFTIDKLMISIMRQLHHIVTDPKAQELLSFFKKNHEHEKSTPQLTQAYRLEVTETLGHDDNLYNLAFDISKRTLSIQLLEKEDETFELNDLGDYTNYVTNYIDWEHDTPNVRHKDMRSTFLKRNISLNQQQQPSEKDIVHSDMQYKICRNTYHMFYVIGAEDAFIRSKPTSSSSSLKIEDRKSLESWLNKKQPHDVKLEEKMRSLLSQGK